MDFEDKKILAGITVFLLVVATGLWISQISGLDDSVESVEKPVEKGENTSGAEPSEPSEIEYSVDCPGEVLNHCRDLSQEYEGDVTYQYKAQYTGMNGSAYYVQLKSDSPVAETGNNTVVIKFDEDSGRVWEIQ